MPDSPLTHPTMTTLAGRPIKIVYQPSADILVACRTAEGDDVHVPLAALAALLAQEIASKSRATAATLSLSKNLAQ